MFKINVTKLERSFRLLTLPLVDPVGHTWRPPIQILRNVTASGVHARPTGNPGSTTEFAPRSSKEEIPWEMQPFCQFVRIRVHCFITIHNESKSRFDLVATDNHSIVNHDHKNEPVDTSDPNMLSRAAILCLYRLSIMSSLHVYKGFVPPGEYYMLSIDLD